MWAGQIQQLIPCTRKLEICLTLKSTDCGREASLRPKDSAFVAGQTTKTNKVNFCLIKARGYVFDF